MSETLTRDPVQVMLEMREALESSRTIISAASGLPLPDNVTIDFKGTLTEIDEAIDTANTELGALWKGRENAGY